MSTLCSKECSSKTPAKNKSWYLKQPFFTWLEINQLDDDSRSLHGKLEMVLWGSRNGTQQDIFPSRHLLGVSPCQLSRTFSTAYLRKAMEQDVTMGMIFVGIFPTTKKTGATPKKSNRICDCKMFNLNSFVLRF